MTKEDFDGLVRKHRGRMDDNDRPVFDRAKDDAAFRAELTARLRSEKPYLDQSWDEIG